jgi:hypothetical protein
MGKMDRGLFPKQNIPLMIFLPAPPKDGYHPRFGGYSFSYFLFWLMILFPGTSLALSSAEVDQIFPLLRNQPVGQKISFWAEKFLGIPYDKDPQGIYVTRAQIVADDGVDCMYLTFRAVELALSRSPEEAVQAALDKRFHTRGILQDGKVLNYDDRFQYGEDMIRSGKWGTDITSRVGRTARIRGSRGYDFYEVLPPHETARKKERLRSGDILFFFKIPEKRVVEEGVGHIGIVKVEEKDSEKKIFLIHAGGTKSAGGWVKKVLLADYLAAMPFVGVKVTRFE